MKFLEGKGGGGGEKGERGVNKSNQRFLRVNSWIIYALHTAGSYWALLLYKKVSKCSQIETLNLDMCLVDLVEETLEFVED